MDAWETWDELMGRYESEALDYLAWIMDTMGSEYTKRYYDNLFTELWLIIFGDEPMEYLDRNHYEAVVRRLHRAVWTHMHRLSWWGDLLPQNPFECPTRKDLPAHHARYWPVYDIDPSREWFE